MGPPPFLVGSATQVTVIDCGPVEASVGADGFSGTVALAVVAMATFEGTLVIKLPRDGVDDRRHPVLPGSLRHRQRLVGVGGFVVAGIRHQNCTCKRLRSSPRRSKVADSIRYPLISSPLVSVGAVHDRSICVGPIVMAIRPVGALVSTIRNQRALHHCEWGDQRACPRRRS